MLLDIERLSSATAWRKSEANYLPDTIHDPEVVSAEHLTSLACFEAHSQRAPFKLQRTGDRNLALRAAGMIIDLTKWPRTHVTLFQGRCMLAGTPSRSMARPG